MAMIYGKLLFEPVMNKGKIVGGRLDHKETEAIEKKVIDEIRKNKKTECIRQTDPTDPTVVWFCTDDSGIMNSPHFVKLTKLETINGASQAANKAPLNPDHPDYVEGRTVYDYKAALKDRTAEDVDKNGIWGGA